MDPRIAARRAQVGRATQRASLRMLARWMGVAAVLAVIVWYLFSPFVDVDEIAVGGVDRADVTGVLADLEVDVGDPLLLVPTGRIESRIAEDPWVSSVAVSRIIPGTIEISVIERLPALAVESPSGVSIVALDGTVLTGTGTRPDDLPVFLGAASSPTAGRTITDGPVFATLEFLDEFGPITAQARFEILDDGLWLRLPEHDVRLGRSVDMAAKAASLRAVLAEQPEPGFVIVLIAPERPTLQPSPPVEKEADAAPDESQPEVEG